MATSTQRFRTTTSYYMEAEIVLMWFPIKTNRNLTEVRMRARRFSHHNRDAGLRWSDSAEPVGTNTTIDEISEPSANEDNLAHERVPIVVVLKMGTNESELFTAELSMQIGRLNETKSFVLLPDSRIPFMMSLQAHPRDEYVSGTAIAVQGIFTTSPNKDHIGSRANP